MAILIPFPEHTETPAQSEFQAEQDAAERVVDAAWKFAYCALWREQAIRPAEIKAAKEHLHLYFQQSADTRKAFIAFCERVLLTHQYISKGGNRYVPNPSLWLNSQYAYGFAGTKQWHEKYLAQRREIKGYLEGIAAVAKGYWDYTAAPSGKAFNDCRKKLVQLREMFGLQIFYNAIICLQFLSN